MLRLLKKVVLGLGLALAALVLLAITFVVGWRELLFGPRARVTRSEPFERTPARVERGRHLVEDVFSCAGCHSPRDWKAPGAPAVATQRLAGANGEHEGMAWLTAPNLTPDAETGSGTWSDDAMARGIREGIGHDGRTLFPMMPYQSYRRIPDEDVQSIVVYLKSLAPVRNPLPATHIPFPLSLLVRSVPQPLPGAGAGSRPLDSREARRVPRADDRLRRLPHAGGAREGGRRAGPRGRVPARGPGGARSRART